MKDHTELNINHHGQDGASSEEGAKSVNLGVDKAIDEFQSKLKSYPLPTSEVGKMTPPPPPQTGQRNTQAKATPQAQPFAQPQPPAQAAPSQPQSKRPKTKVIEKSPTELQIIHEKK